MEAGRGPRCTADLIIGDGQGRVLLVRRRYPPAGWALPGGFLEGGESLEDCARREAREETSLEVRLDRQFHTYSDPARDPRGQTITTVFLASVAGGEPRAADDAAAVAFFRREELPGTELAFDHRLILEDYFNNRY